MIWSGLVEGGLTFRDMGKWGDLIGCPGLGQSNVALREDTEDVNDYISLCHRLALSRFLV